MSPFEQVRMNIPPKIPLKLVSLANLTVEEKATSFSRLDEEAIKSLFPKTYGNSAITFVEGESQGNTPKRVGVCFSGGQAPGGHNVIISLYRGLKQLNQNSILYGFIGGPNGFLKQEYIELNADRLALYLNQGGFDLIGSGRTKIETPAQFELAATCAKTLALDGLVIIGGDDSNTNAALLAEYFLSIGLSTSVVGVPKTIDGDLRNDQIEIPFGFDTACKVYANLIGNIQRDALSAKKYYHFIKLMGRTASHIALECALKTHPNYTLIGEDVFSKKRSLKDIVEILAAVVEVRSNLGIDYGVILLPEGVLEFTSDYSTLLKELNGVLEKATSIHDTQPQEKIEFVISQLPTQSKLYTSLPQKIQLQLLLDRDSHGNLNVSKIETEALLIELVSIELENRRAEGGYKGQFNPQPHFFGYEGRSSTPSNFDANYCYALGLVAALLINFRLTGYIATISNLRAQPALWQPGALPLTSMLTMETRKGKLKPVIRKALVDLEGAAFLKFAAMRAMLAVEDDYLYPEPMQFFGPEEITDTCPLTL